MPRFFILVGTVALMVGLAGQATRAEDNNNRRSGNYAVTPGQPPSKIQPPAQPPNPVPSNPGGNTPRYVPPRNPNPPPGTYKPVNPGRRSDFPGTSGGRSVVIPGKPRPNPDATSKSGPPSTSTGGVSTIPPPAYKTWPRQAPKGYSDRYGYPYGNPYGYGPYSPYNPYSSGYYPNGGYPYGDSPYGYSPYGYSPYSYSPYGYSPYGYGPYAYSPYRTYWPGMGLMGSPYVFSPWYGTYYPGSRSYSPYEYAYAYPAAFFIPAGQLFGPGVGIGVFPDIAPEAVPPGGVNPAGDLDLRPQAAEPPPAAETPPAEEPANSAEQEIRRGDALFASHKHSDALVHYIKAVEQSPDLADGWFRQGFAQAADGEYPLAAKSLRRAMELNPNWAGSSFRLAAMYGTDVMSKRSRMTALYAAAHKDPGNADLQFLIGAHLYFDGKADRAVQYFQRADKLQGK